MFMFQQFSINIIQAEIENFCNGKFQFNTLSREAKVFPFEVRTQLWKLQSHYMISNTLQLCWNGKT